MAATYSVMYIGPIYWRYSVIRVTNIISDGVLYYKCGHTPQAMLSFIYIFQYLLTSMLY